MIFGKIEMFRVKVTDITRLLVVESLNKQQQSFTTRMINGIVRHKRINHVTVLVYPTYIQSILNVSICLVS